MNRDLLLAFGGIAIVTVACFALGSQIEHTPPPLSPPVEKAAAAGAAGAAAKPAPGNVVMRVNGEPVTDREFALFVQALPPQMQAYAANPEARKLIAEQLVRMKVMEQEARKMGAASDPEVALKMELGRTNVYVEYAIRKIAESSNEEALKDEYAKNRERFSVVDLSHILIAYRGGGMPARSGEAPPPDQAMAKARSIVQRLRGGADFEAAAKEVSDDQNTAESGGSLGAVPVGSLPPDIAPVIEKIPTGQVSEPHRSQYGIHVFKVKGRRLLTFQEVKDQLQRGAQQNVVNAEIERLQKSAKVELDPKFFGDGKKPQG